MAKCDHCKVNDAVENQAIIIKGIFYRNICSSCFNADGAISSGHAEWERTLDAQDREADIQQPWNADGSINTRFAKLYPKQAEAVFTKEELDKAMRS